MLTGQYDNVRSKTKMVCSKCGVRSTIGGIERAKTLAAGKTRAELVWTYERGYAEGQADRKKGQQADIPFNAPHLAKRHQEDWMRGYRDGWNGLPMKESRQFPRFAKFLSEQITDSELRQLEAFLDGLFAAFKIDVEFTTHFKERVNDARNGKPITIEELNRLFRETLSKYGKRISQMHPNAEAVLQDLRTKLNLPFVVKYDRQKDEIDFVAKTIMRKDRFMTPDRILQV